MDEERNYVVVAGKTLEELQTRVNALTTEDWLPVGSVTINRGYSISEAYLQAMFRIPERE